MVHIRQMLVALALLAATGAHAQQTFNWFSPLESNSQSTISSLQTDGKDNIFTFAAFGTKDDGTGKPTGRFLGRTFTGAPYTEGNSYNKNLLLVKHDKEGNILWAVNTDRGDIYDSSSDFVPTPDGGAFLALKCRRTGMKDHGDIIFRMTGTDGKVSTVTWKSQLRAYQPVFVKIDGTGRIEHIATAVVDTSAMPDADYYSHGTPDGIELYSTTTDDEGNFYIAGRLRKPMTIDGVTIEPHNTDGWDGDSQVQVGCSFILKLDGQLKYVSHIVSGGKAVYDQLKQIAYEDGKLYTAGIYKADGTSPISIGEKEFTPAGGECGLFAARLDTDLKADWAAHYSGYTANERNNFHLEFLSFDMSKEKFYIGGGLWGGLNVNNSMTVETPSQQLNGLLVACDAESGVATNALVVEDTKIGKIMGVADRGDSLYVYGYDWGRRNDIAYLDVYTKDLTLKNTYTLMSSRSGQMTAWSFVTVGNDIIAANRDKQKMELSFEGTDETYKNSEMPFFGILVSYTIGADSSPSDPDSDIETRTSYAEDRMITVHTKGQTVYIANAEGMSIRIYDMTGRCINEIPTAGNEEAVRITVRGIYIVKAGESVTKIII